MHTLENILVASSVIYETKYDSLKVNMMNFWIYPENLNENSLYFHWQIGKQYLIKNALAKGAFVITSDSKFYQENSSISTKLIFVHSVKDTLLKIAKYKRNIFDGHIITVTGSIGKSTVKNMLVALFSLNASTIYTLGNENTWLGNSCILAGIKTDTKFVILETAAAGKNSLSKFINIIKPTVSILLDVNFSHQERYNSYKDLIFEKASIIDNLQVGGHLFISEITYKKLIEYNYQFRDDIDIHRIGKSPDNETIIKNFLLGKKESSINIAQGNKNYSLKIKQSNIANLINAVYVFNVFKEFNYSLKKFNALMNFYTPLPRRFERFRVLHNEGKVFELIDDAYNSSPESVRNSLKSLEIRKPCRKILILGDMLELGKETESLHNEILNDSLMNQFDEIIYIGEILSKLLPNRENVFKSVNDSLDYIKCIIKKGDLILLKASNGVNFIYLRKIILNEAIIFNKSEDWFIENEY